MFLLLLALHYSMNHWIRRTFWLRIIAVILPIGTLIIYYPPIFHYLAEKFIGFQIFIIDFSLAWIVVFVLASIALFLYEAFSINLKIFRRPFEIGRASCRERVSISVVAVSV